MPSVRVRIPLIAAFLQGLLILLLACVHGSPAHAQNAQPSSATDLSGYWRLNVQLSDDGEALLQKRLDRERKAWERRRERAIRAGVIALPPLESEQPLPQAPSSQGELSPAQQRRYDPLRVMLGMTQALEITQDGRRVEIRSDAEYRRFDAGTRSQVSMREGELADSKVGWRGNTFVIERKVRRGPQVVERYRLLKSGQLEGVIAWSGDHLLAGIKVRRVFDRAEKPAVVLSPAVRPGR